MGSLKLTKISGAEIRGSVLNNLFANGTIGEGDVYALAEVRNTHSSMTITTGSVWVTVDLSGGSFAIALADVAPRVLDWGYQGFDATGLSYSTPTTQAAGLVLPTLAPLQKVLIGLRRNLVGAAASWPENNVLNIGFTVPVGYT